MKFLTVQVFPRISMFVIGLMFCTVGVFFPKWMIDTFCGTSLIRWRVKTLGI